MAAATLERFALTEIVCSLPAETIVDAVIQIEAAYELADGLTGAFEGPEGTAHNADLDRVLLALGSALRVISALPGAEIPMAQNTIARPTWSLRWKGGLPPVRIGQEGLQ